MMMYRRRQLLHVMDWSKTILLSLFLVQLVAVSGFVSPLFQNGRKLTSRHGLQAVDKVGLIFSVIYVVVFHVALQQT
jgi:hypothetical protein